MELKVKFNSVDFEINMKEIGTQGTEEITYLLLHPHF